MSFYDMCFGVNQLAPALLATLGFNVKDIPRFRDCYIDDGKILIYTRTGGGNRDYYESEDSCRDCYPEYFNGSDDDPSGPWNEDLRQNPYYLYDNDDDFDCTYAYFTFKFPPEYEEDLRAIVEKNNNYSPSEKWKLLFETTEE